MYNFYDDFSIRRENKQPVSIDVEKNSRYNHNFGYVENGEYQLNCTGGRHIIKTPPLKTFKLKTELQFIAPILGEVKYGLYFGYDKLNRSGKLVILAYNDDNNTLDFILFSASGDILTRITERRYTDVRLEADTAYTLGFDIFDGGCRVKFEEYEASFECDSEKGYLALTKYYGSAGYRLSYVSVCSDEEPAKTLVLNKSYYAPEYDGGVHGHNIELLIYEYEDGLKEINVNLSGGVEFTVPIPADWSLWTSKVEWFKNPYVRFIGDCESERYLLKDGKKLIFVDNVNRNSRTIAKVNLAEPIATRENPYSKTYLSHEYKSHKYFVFGYEQFKALQHDACSDRSEFVFDENANLVYYGRPLSDDLIVDVSSEKHEIEEKIKACDFGKKDDALYFIRENHYFTTNEKPTFSVRIMHRKDARFVKCKFYLESTYFKKICEIEPAEVSTRVNEFGLHEINAKLVLDSLEQKIYHLKTEFYNGNELIFESESAFDVIDPAKKESPVESSGLPFLHSGDCLLFDPYPWMKKPDFSPVHYYDSIVCEPSLVEELKTWEIMDIYRKKHCVWMTARTVGKRDFFELEECIKHTDYLNLGFPGIEDSGNYYRYDYFFHALYSSKKLRERYNEFCDLHPEYKLNKANLAESSIPLSDFHALQPYFDEWVDFANEMAEELFSEQWQRIKAINPNVKRYSYGPFNLYSTDSVGGEIMKYYGYNHKNLAERFDGFMQFEDYVFCCDYPLAYSSWAMATNKILAPSLEISPELYDSFEVGCPDGHVSYPRPPFSDSYAYPHQTVSQIYAYLYNSVYYNGNGFNYYNDNRFMMLSVYDLEFKERMRTFVDGWGKYLDNKPARPKKTVCYLYKYSEKDNRFALENPAVTTERGGRERTVLYNKCASAMYYIYEKLSEEGLPAGFIADTLDGLSENEIDVLVIPSVYALSEKDIKAIKKLHASGVKLVATGDVHGLCDIFGVEECERSSYVNQLNIGEKSEGITPFTTRFQYKANGAKTLLYANGECLEAVLENNGNILINVDLGEVGVENFPYVCTIGGRVNISALMKECVIGAIKAVLHPTAEVSADCYANVFESENGNDEIILYDNTPFYGTDKQENRVTVTLNTDEYTDVEPVSREGMKITKCYENGVLRAFELVIRLRETLLFKLTKK